MAARIAGETKAAAGGSAPAERKSGAAGKVRMTKRRQQAMETRSRILRCALDLFEERGYDNVSMQEIAEVSGTSIGSIYHYFKSKEEMTAHSLEFLDDVYHGFMEEMEAESGRDSGGAGELTGIDKLKRFYIFVQKTVSLYENMRSLYIYSLRNPDRNTLSMTDSRELYRIYRELIEECREEGSIRRDVSDQEIMDLLLQSSRGMIVDWLIRDKAFDLERQAEKWFYLIAYAVCPDQGSGRA